MRIREDGWSGTPSVSTLTGTSWWVDTDNTQGSTDWTSSQLLGDTPNTAERMEDVVVADFYKRMRQGEIISNPMYHITEEFTPAVPTSMQRCMLSKCGPNDTLKCGLEYSGMNAMTTKHLGGFLPTLGEDLVNYTNERSLSSAYANMNNTEWALSMVAAEANKTVASIALILQRVVKIIIAVKRLDSKYLRKQISQKELENRYMELRYAIRPLFIDVQNAQNAYNKHISDVPKRYTFRGYAEGTETTTDTLITNPDSANNTYTVTVSRKCETVCDSRSSILCDVHASKLNILGVDQLFETLWEITPWSFIINWFVNIGTFIAAWTPNAGIRQLASHTTHVITFHLSNETDTVETTSAYQVIWDKDSSFDWSGKQTKLVIVKRRSVNPQLSKLPNFNINLDALKILDLIIILKKLFFR
jgi:hypothetical protein